MFVRRLETFVLKIPVVVNLSHARSIEQSGIFLDCCYPPATLFDWLFGASHVRRYRCKSEEDAKQILDEFLRYGLNK
jgi:hypothetical protein